MKKKIIIAIVLILLIIIGVLIYLFLFKDNSKTTITMDINPSIELKLDDKNKVIKVKALNSDAKSLISDNLNELYYDEAILKIIDIVREKQEFKDDRIFVLIDSKGELNKVKIKEKIDEEIAKRSIAVDIIIPNEITEEDKALAKKYNITEAKANYLNGIKKDYPDVNIDDIKDDSLENLHETRETGNTCPDGYKIENIFCIKEIERKKAILSKVCPEGYMGDNNTCYKEGQYTEGDKLTCRSDFQLIEEECVKKEEREVRGKCEEGGDFRLDLMKCVYQEDVGPGKEYCRITPGEDLLYNGRCLGRKPTINGRCLGSDKVINGWCYDTSAKSGYEAEWKCPDGSLVSHKDYEKNGNTCYKETVKDHLGLYCDDDFTLEGTKCVRYEKEAVFKEHICESGYTLINNDQCVMKNDTKEMIDGYICDTPNSKLIGDICVIYEKIKANSNQ